MSLTITEARDEILALLKAAWDAGSPSQGLTLMYPDVKISKPEAASNGEAPAWARAQVQHASGSQATLANHEGQSRFRRSGIVTVQIFTPFGTGLVLADQLATIVKNAFEGVQTPSGVIFRDVTPNEIGEDGPWFNVNVLAQFEYDEIR